MALEDDLRVIMQRELAPGVDDLAHLEAMETHDLLATYANWANRFPTPIPRQVIYSRELIRRLKRDGALRRWIRTVDHEVTNGVDLERRLSRDVDISHNSPSAPRRRRYRDLDRFLSAWGLHHLHLGPRPQDGSRVRSSTLLFVAFVQNRAYFVGAFAHGTWDRDILLAIMADNWPDDDHAPLIPIRGALGLERSISEEDRVVLRKGHVSTFYERGNRIYAARSGITTAGTAMDSTQWANRVMRSLDAVQNLVEHDPTELLKQFQRLGGSPTSQPTWKIVVRDKVLVVADERSETHAPLLQF
ncbi:hypothetical protein ACNKF0_19240 [Nocardioides sp. T5]|uniref:hypothetical protein n=1 Tax=Nocardioides sp. T5 TaxID=3400182 RepID=UPI003A84D9CE